MFDFGWLAWTLLGTALAVVICEVMIPSAGVLGVIALSLGLAGGWFAWRDGGSLAVLGYGLAAVIGAATAALVALVILPHSPVGKKMQLVAPSLAERAPPAADPSLVGRNGVALTPLRPAGFADIDGRRVLVLTRGDHLDAGTRVRVIAIEGSGLIVKNET
jgi:membrane-bound serine protease (ClpP class)